MKTNLLILLIGIAFVGCSGDNEAIESTIQEEATVEVIEVEVDTTLQEYINLVEQNEYSIAEYIRMAKKIGRINTGVEELEFLKVVYRKDSTNIDLNLLVGYAFLFTYEYEGDEHNRKRAEEILDYTLNMDDDFATYSEGGLKIKQMKRFRDFWNKSDDEVKENVLTWSLLMDFDMDSDLYKEEIESKW
jgi:hypothetical protein